MNELITKVNKTVANRGKSDIRYIVIHYTGATGSAEANCKYFYDTYRGSSAHYFVNHDGAIWRCVEDKDIAWHCGAKTYVHPECRNQNSIGIEMCCKKDNKWCFEEATVNAAIELTKELMSKYDIPVERVIRHYDVTGKNCPEPYVRVPSDWTSFKNRLNGMSYSVGWHESGGRWWYQYESSRYGYYKSCLKEIDGTVYAFDKEGWIKQGKFTCSTDENGAVYLMGE